MGLVETYVNLKAYDTFDIAAYPLQRGEANECIQALERLIPKKARVDAEGEKTVTGFCPVCEAEIHYIKRGFNPSMKGFCPYCGQKIDWSA